MNLSVLDEQKFHYCCQLLVQQSQQLKDGWCWETVTSSDEGYLKKIIVRTVVIGSRLMWNHESSRTSSSFHQKQEDQMCETENLNAEADGDDEDDGLCTFSESRSLVLQYEYHIVYSYSYSTPVLYFRAFSLEGRSVSLEDMWRSVHPSLRLSLQKNRLSTISLQEHPLLGQPFFMLHPCRTEEFMRPVLQDQLSGTFGGPGCSPQVFHPAPPSRLMFLHLTETGRYSRQSQQILEISPVSPFDFM
ncbi:ubiquitin-like-conjugating enzyme ATG10 isoform X1 [Takifugu rubripes]|uniref:ubiquitin-like-conjugating enzyme ATG10 isoform X1 n=1 Tax=Takifugu rubripes TaxID=31033 RepID=UPI001145FA6E|nr:ubiquitin-like-conjugating enzyme ATG10 isoform X1 [Takifugu rubripes]XP_029687380.1 ubiquitin-like-conjugating enzyme ATG10 isoform X1 [Takifugu rubripes]XP_029687381.1 ubiquitin-like-conjugating enzyme ATG10 isoform X1 [Takifugu rubripes]